MLSVIFASLFFAIGISCCASQSIPKVTTSTWNFYSGSEHGLELTLKTSLSSSTAWPGQSVVTFVLDIAIDKGPSQYNYIQGLSLELMNENLFCATGTQSDCLPLPSDPSYPSGKLYEHQASRKWFLSFVNTGEKSAIICKYGMMNEFCKTKAECDALGWTSMETLMTEMKKKSTDSSAFNFLTLKGKEKKGEPYHLQILDGSKTLSEDRTKIFYQYTFDIPDQFFNIKRTDPTYDLGLTTGATRYMSFGLWKTTYTGISKKDCTNSNAAGESTFRKMFEGPYYVTSAFPWSPDRKDQFSGRFVEFPSPTAAPTKKPTLSPTTQTPTRAPTTAKPTKAPTTGKPTKAPTDFPTKNPTTARPSKAPTTPKPTKAPTDYPTKKPTLAPTMRPTKAPTSGKPTRAPTMRPSKAPTTPKPTSAPTEFPTKRPSKSPTPGPTTAPVQFFCPNSQKQELCQRINTWFPHLSYDVSRRMKNVRRLCVANRCHWCSYQVDGVAVGQCRPKYPEENSQYKVYSYEQACPKDRSDPFETCDMFPDCPAPEEMTACKELNKIPGYKKNLCENGFSLDVAGTRISVGAKRCAYNKGTCRAVGDYFWARKTFFRLPGYFDHVRGCPYAPSP